MKKVVLMALLGTWIPFGAGADDGAADLILTGGKIFTAVPGATFAEALAVHNGRISAVGTSAEIEGKAAKGTRRIDLRGRTVVPGFNDAHAHFDPDPASMSLLFDTMEPTWEQVQAVLATLVAKAPPETLMIGTVGRGVVLNEDVTRFALDRVAPDHPVLLRTYYGHGFVLSSRAMSNLGIAEDEPDPLGGYYERVGQSTRINGRIWEYPQWNVARALTERVPDQDVIVSLRAMADEAVAFGITSMQIFPSMPVHRFVRLLTHAQLPIRIRAIAFPPTSTTGRDVLEGSRVAALSPSSTMITASGIKWILDGTPIEHGAAMREPYFDRQNLSGKLNFTQDEIAKMIDESLALDQPLLLHCSGDRSAELVLHTLEERTNVAWPKKRVRIEHGDGVYGDLSARAARLGVIVVQNPSHFVRELVGDRFAADTPFFALRSSLERGVPIALGSDGPMNPFLNIMLASIHPMRPDEAITREQAVVAYTSGSAYAEFAEGEKGTIEIGKRADLAVLSHDVFAVATEQLPALRSVLTFVDGKVVYEAPGSPLE